MRHLNVGIKGTGSYLPSKILTNKEIEKVVNTSDDWIFQKLGISERRIAEDHESPSYMGFEAAKKALESSGLTIDDIDLIIVATSSPEKISPSTACIIHSKFNTKKNIPAFDINAVCSGFVYGVNLATPLISLGVYENVLIIGTEAYSKITNWKDPHCVFFGDGAGAIVLGKTDRGWISCDSKANGKETGMTGFTLPLNSYFEMNGKEVWNQAIKVLPWTILSVSKNADFPIENIDLIIPHQASINILKNVAGILNFPFERFKTVMHKYGNIAAASIPIALDESMRDEEFKKNKVIALAAIGSGWVWGSTLICFE